MDSKKDSGWCSKDEVSNQGDLNRGRGKEDWGGWSGGTPGRSRERLYPSLGLWSPLGRDRGSSFLLFPPEKASCSMS